MYARILLLQEKRDKLRGGSPTEFRVDTTLLRFTERRREIARLEALQVLAREIPRLTVALEALTEVCRRRKTPTCAE